MAVGLQPPDTLLPVPGIRLATTAAGIRYAGRDDLVLIGDLLVADQLPLVTT